MILGSAIIYLIYFCNTLNWQKLIKARLYYH